MQGRSAGSVFAINQAVSDAPADSLADLIVGYLRDRPGAMDSFRGIAEWWLMRQQLRVELDRLRTVLMQLRQDGILEAEGVGPEQRYWLKASRGQGC